MRGAGEADGEYIFELRTEGSVGCDGPCNRYIASVSHMHVCCTQRGIRCEPVVKKGGNATDSPFCQIKSGKGVFSFWGNISLRKAQEGGYSWEYLKSYRQEVCWHS